MKSTQVEIIECSLPKSKRQDEDDWTLWEHKTFNIHRAILYWPNKSDQTYPEMSDAIRNKIYEKFKVSWWRGFGYGAIIKVPTIPNGIDKIDDSIDIRDNQNGTWQWTILVCQESNSIIAVHTWMAGFLTPIYEALLNSYRTEGYEVGNFKKEKDKLMKFLTKLSALKGVDFRDVEPK
nr:hypothetical protein [Desulfobacula sp.]